MTNRFIRIYNAWMALVGRWPRQCLEHTRVTKFSIDNVEYDINSFTIDFCPSHCEVKAFTEDYAAKQRKDSNIVNMADYV